MGDDTRTCGYCGGTGRAPLRAPLQATLDVCRAIEAGGDTVVATTVWEHGKSLFPTHFNRTSQTTANNRLGWLVEAGLLRRVGGWPVRYALVDEEDGDGVWTAGGNVWLGKQATPDDIGVDVLGQFQRYTWVEADVPKPAVDVVEGEVSE